MAPDWTDSPFTIALMFTAIGVMVLVPAWVWARDYLRYVASRRRLREWLSSRD